MIRISDGAGLARELLQQVEDLRLHRDVERRGRLVGDDQARLAGQRHGDHRRAGACRRSTGADRSASRLAASGMRTRPQQLLGLRRAPCAQGAPRCRLTGSATCMPTVSAGFSDDIGSWKIIAMRLPRMARMPASSSLQQVLALEHDLAARRCARAAWGSGAGSTAR